MAIDYAKNIFQKGSKTFYTSSRFFPEDVRKEITVLYSFVRTADDFVDAIPQDKIGFLNFKKNYFLAHDGKKVTNRIIRNFCKLEKEKQFDPAWTKRFLQAMKADLSKKVYRTIDETEQYIDGSANVIGLFLAKIMDLPDRSYPHAELLGKSMQYINFVRDIEEDNALQRIYLPFSEMKQFGLKSLREEEAKKYPEQFTAFIHYQLERYKKWHKEAEKGYAFIPNKFLIPIKTASDLYIWTAGVIEKDPFIVYRKKVKPSRLRIFLTGIKNSLLYLPLYRSKNKWKTGNI